MSDTALRMKAAARRRAAMTEQMVRNGGIDTPGTRRLMRSQAPVGVGLARSVPFPAKMTSQRITRDSDGFDTFPARVRAKLEEKAGSSFYRVEGYATTFEQSYEMWDFFGPYDEIVKAGAADKTLAAHPDVAFLVNHKGLSMARTVAGTLELSADTHGMQDVGWLNPERGDVHDLVIGIDDLTVTEQSFAFMIPSGGGWWSDDFMTFEIREFDIDRGDVSAVNYGANPYTSIAARQRELWEELDRLPSGIAREAINRLRHRDRRDLDLIYVDFDDDEGDTQTCPSCGAGNEADAQYCDQCGASMTGTAVAATAPEAAESRKDAAMAGATGTRASGSNISTIQAMVTVAEAEPQRRTTA